LGISAQTVLLDNAKMLARRPEAVKVVGNVARVAVEALQMLKSKALLHVEARLLLTNSVQEIL
jgi:hypothetical protein